MIKTKFTEMFGVKYPIIQSGMQWLGVPEFASVVCNAGGMGTINTSCWDTPEELREALEPHEHPYQQALHSKYFDHPGSGSGSRAYSQVHFRM